MYIFTDEAGDDGLKSHDKHKIIVFSHFLSFDDIRTTVEDFNQLSRELFGNPLRSWKNQKGKVKNDPQLLKKFFREFINKDYRKFVLSLGIIEKDFYKSSKGVKSETIQLYSNLFRRSIPFYKRLYYQAGLYDSGKNPRIKWFIDRNDDKGFIQPLKDNIESYSKSAEVILDGPKFMPKPRNLQNASQEKRLFAKAIEMTDNFSGVILKYLREQKRDYEDVCKLIVSKAKGFDITFNKKKLWKWDGVMVSPIVNWSKYKNIIGEPYYNAFDDDYIVFDDEFDF